ncbi:MAG: chemoreceptor glutamine deamidase CheD [Pseudomonadales bacterium]|nr:chemoreceptor glutamine deamidase CheD [Pseudomonadales bacterium]
MPTVGQWARDHYLDRHFGRMATKLLPGEYYATRDTEVIVTVLGSCVAACLLDPGSGVAGMNHFLLPDNGDGDQARSARYGVHAMELLYNQLVALGADRRRIQAKVFGGGQVIEGMTHNPVGQRNAVFVRDFLAREGIPLVAEDLLGDCARKVFLFTDTGQVWVKKIRNYKNDTIQQRERQYRERAKRAAVEGAWDLFVQ